MNKEHGQVTGIIWRGPDDLALYQRLKEYADKKVSQFQRQPSN